MGSAKVDAKGQIFEFKQQMTRRAARGKQEVTLLLQPHGV